MGLQRGGEVRSFMGLQQGEELLCTEPYSITAPTAGPLIALVVQTARLPSAR